MKTAVALTIAGSDPSGGAGMQADLKTFHQHGVYGMSVLTLLTVQNTQGVKAVKVLDPEFVIAQLETVLEDIPPAAAKTGALGTSEVIEAVALKAREFRFPLVVDPVMLSKHGDVLLEPDATRTLCDKLLPAAFLVTPNLPEASALTEMQVNDPSAMERAAQAIAKRGPQHVLVKGGHLPQQAMDVLWSNGQIYQFPNERLASQNTHGTGCVLAAAITAWLARDIDLIEAVKRAKAFVTRAIQTSPGIGRGYGPTNLHAKVPSKHTRAPH